MTVSSVTTVHAYMGDGVQKDWPILFPFFSPEEVKAVRTATDGVNNDLVYGSDYSVSKLESGGTCLCTLGNGERLTLYLDLDLVQQTDLSNTGILAPEILEKGFDRLTLIAQQHKEAISRCVQVGRTSGLSPSDLLDSIDVNASACLAAQNISVSAAASAESARDAAVASAAIMNMPQFAIGDAGKGIVVASDGSGWVLAGNAAGRDVGTAPDQVPTNADIIIPDPKWYREQCIVRAVDNFLSTNSATISDTDIAYSGANPTITYSGFGLMNTFVPAVLFDSVAGSETSGTLYPLNSVSLSWLQMEFAAPVALSKWRIHFAASYANGSGWTVEASNDGLTWTTQVTGWNWTSSGDNWVEKSWVPTGEFTYWRACLNESINAHYLNEFQLFCREVTMSSYMAEDPTVTIPTHSTYALAGSGTITYSNEYAADQYRSWRAFDDQILNNEYGWLCPATTGWIKYTFESAKIIGGVHYTTAYSGHASYMPSNMQVYLTVGGVETLVKTVALHMVALTTVMYPLDSFYENVEAVRLAFDGPSDVWMNVKELDFVFGKIVNATTNILVNAPLMLALAGSDGGLIMTDITITASCSLITDENGLVDGMQYILAGPDGIDVLMEDDLPTYDPITGAWTKSADKTVNYNPDPTFIQPLGTTFLKTTTPETITIVDGNVIFTGAAVNQALYRSGSALTVPSKNDFMDEGARVHVTLDIDSISGGAIRFQMWKNSTDGSVSENLGPNISTAGRHEFVVECDADSETWYLIVGSGTVTAVVSKIDVWMEKQKVQHVLGWVEVVNGVAVQSMQCAIGVNVELAPAGTELPNPFIYLPIMATQDGNVCSVVNNRIADVSTTGGAVRVWRI